MHIQVAEHFLKSLHVAFASEEAMVSAASRLGLSFFDRTTTSRIFLKKLLDEAQQQVYPERNGRMSENGYDAHQIAAALISTGSPSLVSQVVPNLLAVPLTIAHPDPAAVKGLCEDIKKAGGPDPREPKAKKIAADVSNAQWVHSYNHALAIHKTFGSCEQGRDVLTSVSFRLSPTGSTPAFADSSYLSGLSPLLDHCVIPTDPRQAIFHLSWAPEVAAIRARETQKEAPEGGVFLMGEGPFKSKSGGDMLFHSVFSRQVSFEAMQILLCTESRDSWYVMPRLFSTLIVVDASELQDVMQRFRHKFGEHEIHIGNHRMI